MCRSVLLLFLVALPSVRCVATPADAAHGWFEADALAMACANFREAEKEKFQEAGGLLNPT